MRVTWQYKNWDHLYNLQYNKIYPHLIDKIYHRYLWYNVDTLDFKVDPDKRSFHVERKIKEAFS